MIANEVFIDNYKTKENYEMLVNPGIAYLKMMQYYADEKLISENQETNNAVGWEKFISEQFSENCEMCVELYTDNKKLYELSKINY
jgi:hypothetical protein